MNQQGSQLYQRCNIEALLAVCAKLFSPYPMEYSILFMFDSM